MTHVWMTWRKRSIQGIFSEGIDNIAYLPQNIESVNYGTLYIYY